MKLTRNKAKLDEESTVDLDSGEITEMIQTNPDIDENTPKAWDRVKARQWKKIYTACQMAIKDEYAFLTKQNAMALAHDFAYFGEAGQQMYMAFGEMCDELEEEQLLKKFNRAMMDIKRKNGKQLLNKLGEAGYRADRDGDDVIYMAQPYRGFSKDISEDMTDEMIQDLKNWGFCAYNNSYYFTEGMGEVVYLNQISNFTLRVLHHIEAEKDQRRMIEFVNENGKVRSRDIPTDELAEMGRFRKISEGLGYFMFYGKPEDFMRIKAKLYEEEKSAEQLETLGWHEDGFFAFSNGVYQKEFIEVDEYGMFSFNEKNYFIPSHPKTNRYSFINEKKFFYRPSSVTFKEWCTHYCGAFGDVGKVMLLFGVATIFSDIIYRHKNNFPMIFLYGEGGSGKSTVIQFLQMLFGVPQAPIKLTEKANTDKAKIRKLAQFVNAMTCFEEFTDTLDMNVIKTLSGLYDRFGYERSDIKSKYGTESVPVESSVAITGNFYPNDDPLLQRLILMDYNINTRSKDVLEHFDKLQLINIEGITNITGSLIKYRDLVDKQFPLNYRRIYSEFYEACKEHDIKVPSSRMVENYTVILVTYHILNPELKFTFSYTEVFKFLIETMASHTEKMDTSGVVQIFWDIVLYMANPKVRMVKHGEEYSIEGDEIYIRFKALWTLYNKAHFDVHRRPGVPYNTLLGKLKDKSITPAYIETKDNKRFAGNYDNNSSAMVFRYPLIGVELPAGHFQDDPRGSDTDSPPKVSFKEKIREETEDDREFIGAKQKADW